MKGFQRIVLILGVTVLWLGWLAADARAQQEFEEVLYSFTGAPDGVGPVAGLIKDSSGNLYGTTQSGGASGQGTVFELVNSSGTYTEKVLYSFTGAPDGAGPVAGLIMDASGNLYGTTAGGGASSDGTVFELVNSSGTYTEEVLYSFTGIPDGAQPRAGLIMDSSGNLYGTTAGGGGVGINNYCPPIGCGTVFELVNSSGTYTEKVLYSFTGNEAANPYAGLIMDSSGNLYGTTVGGCTVTSSGTVFELVNSSGTYTENLLYCFFFNGAPDGANPVAGLIMDASGNLYGTTPNGGASGVGTAFELVNSSGTYTEKVLYSFGGFGRANPYAGLIMDSSGNLYGTTLGGNGEVFELVNSSGTYTEKVLYYFMGVGPAGVDGVYPYAGLIMDSSGNLYGTTQGGGASSAGTVFELFSCTQTGTTMTLASSSNPASAFDSITLTATVTGACTVPPLGTVQFFNGADLLGTVPVTGGVATLTFEDADALGIGTFTLTAQYNPPQYHPTNRFFASSVTVSQTVNFPGVAVTTGSNTFAGNQTVTGNLTAADLFGNGSNLTSLNPANLNSGTAGINITGNAATATSAVTATTAGSAATASSLTGPTGQCATNLFATGITAAGNANCLQPASSNLSDSSSLVRQTPIFFNSGGENANNKTFVGLGATSSDEASVQQVVPISGHFVGMQCFVQTAPISSMTFTLRKNGANTLAVCTIPAGSKHGAASFSSISFAAGDLLDILVSGSVNKAVSIAVATTP